MKKIKLSIQFNFNKKNFDLIKIIYNDKIENIKIFQRGFESQMRKYINGKICIDNLFKKINQFNGTNFIDNSNSVYIPYITEKVLIF